MALYPLRTVPDLTPSVDLARDPYSESFLGLELFFFLPLQASLGFPGGPFACRAPGTGAE